jgi:hypothetical protein
MWHLLKLKKKRGKDAAFSCQQMRACKLSTRLALPYRYLSKLSSAICVLTRIILHGP